jgi:hypothetical protein
MSMGLQTQHLQCLYGQPSLEESEQKYMKLHALMDRTLPPEIMIRGMEEISAGRLIGHPGVRSWTTPNGLICPQGTHNSTPTSRPNRLHSYRLHQHRSHNSSICPHSSHSNNSSGTTKATSNNPTNGTREILMVMLHPIHSLEEAPMFLSHPNNGTQVASVWQWRRGNSNQNNTKAPYSNTQKNSSTSSIVSPAATSLTMKATNAPLEYKYKDNTCHTSRGMKPNCMQIVEPA